MRDESELLKHGHDLLRHKVTLYEQMTKRLSNEQGLVLPSENRLLQRLIDDAVTQHGSQSYFSDE